MRIKIIKIAISSIALGDMATGMDQTLKAVAFMKDNPDDFPTFMESDESKALDLQHNDTPIFSMM